jgi:hypothetical protein
MPYRGFELRGRGVRRYRVMGLVGPLTLALGLLVAGCGVTTANGGESAPQPLRVPRPHQFPPRPEPAPEAPALWHAPTAVIAPAIQH